MSSNTNQFWKIAPQHLPRVNKDTSKTKKIFDELGLIPYAGDGGATYQGYLPFLEDLQCNSPALDSCMDKIRTSSFNLPSARKISNGFLNATDDINEQESGRILLILEGLGLSGDILSDVARGIFTAIEQNGNAWLLIKTATVLGQKAVSIEVMQTSRMGIVKAPNGELFAIRVNNWNDLKKKEVELFTYSTPKEFKLENRGGTTQTVLHIKTGGQGVYGESPMASVFRYALADMQVADYTNRELGNDFIAKLIIMFQGAPEIGKILPPQNVPISTDANNATQQAIMASVYPDSVLPDTDSGLAAVSRRVNNKMTRKSESAEGVVLMEYPNSSTPGNSGQAPSTVTLPPMTNEKLLETMAALASKKIHAKAGVSPVLTGMERPASGLNTNSYKDEFQIFVSETVTYWQDVAGGWFAAIFGCIDAALQVGLTGYTLSFASPADRFKDEQLTFNGAQVTALQQILSAAFKGEMSTTAAQKILEKMFNFSEQEAIEMLQ